MLALALCVPFLFGGWVWDDHVLLESARPGGWLSLWTEPITPVTSGPGSSYYRPFALSVMMLLSKLGGPFAIHLAAGALHAISTHLVWKMLHASGARASAVPLAMVFAAHPVATEVLGWASALPDALSTALSLGALWACRTSKIGPFVALALLALLSKESAIAFVCVAPWVAAESKPERYDLRTLKAAMGLLVLWAAVRIEIAGVSGPSEILYASSLMEAPFELASLLIWPWPITAARDAWLMGTTHLTIGIAALATILIYSRKTGRIHWFVAMTGLILLATPIVAQSHFVADRYVYPAVSCAILALARLEMPKRANHFLTALCGVFVLTTHIPRASDWRDDNALFQSATKAQPTSAYSWHLLGVVKLHQNAYSEAASAFKRALELEHPLAEDSELLLVALVEAGDYPEAVAWIENNHQIYVTARYLAYAAKSFLHTGNVAAAASNIGALRLSDGSYDGPEWVDALADEIHQASQKNTEDPTLTTEPTRSELPPATP